MQRILVGVDAGGTRSTAALSIDGTVVRTYGGGAGNPNVAGVDGAADAIAACVARVLGDMEASVIVAGVAGTGKTELRRALTAQLQERFPRSRVEVCHDASIALRAVIPNGDGIVAIAGTGSIVYAEVGEQRVRAGGEGYRSGDPGSAYAIGLAALDRPHAASIAEIAEYARNVVQKAGEGDAAAAAILDDAANALYRMIEEVALHCPPKTPLAFSGGLLRERNVFAQRLERRIADSALPVRVVEERVEPYVGALARAAQIAES